MRKLVDVGGGEGALMAGILANPKLRGVVFDMPRVAEGANAQIAAAGLADRCEFVGGDFFETVPAGADAYTAEARDPRLGRSKATGSSRTSRGAMGLGRSS